MCGIVGVAGNLDKTSVEVFHDMLQFDVVRGPHSTGVAIVNKEDAVVVKGVLLPQQIIDSPEYKIEIAEPTKTCLIGHNRFATKGAVNAENAHPHKDRHITLVHNGTLFTQAGLPEHERFTNDSMNITFAIAEIGIKDTWKKIDGAATIVFWDNNNRTLNIASNGKRPIWYMYSKKHDKVFWASELWMIKIATERHDVALDKQVWYLNPDTLLEFTYHKGKNKVNIAISNLDKYIPTIYHKTVDVYDRSCEWDNGEYLKWYESKVLEYKPRDKQLSVDLVKKEEKEKKEEKYSLESLEFLQKKNVSKERFLKLYPECRCCAISLSSFYEEAYVVDEYTAVCPDCMETAVNTGMVQQLSSGFLF